MCFVVPVINAEALMCQMIVNHNLPMAAADTLVDGFKLMFPDSKIASQMHCGRKKATCLVKTLAKTQQQCLTARLENMAFTLSTDGGNDSTSKQYPVVVRSIDQETGLVNSELLSLPTCTERSTGENIFNLLNAELQSRNLRWENCLALGCDNAAVMTGRKNGVFAYIKKKHPNVYLAGCCLHLVHIGAQKGAKCLPDVGDILQDIYYYFQKSDKRLGDFSRMQEMFDTEQKKMLKHVCTRWLSIGRCLERLLHNWVPLKEFFKSEKQTQDKSRKSNKCGSYASNKVENVLNFLRSPTNKLYVLFLNYTVKMYDSVLVGLQSEEPKVHTQQRALVKLIKSVMSRFVKPSAMRDSVDKVDFKNSKNQKDDKDLIIGDQAQSYIAESEKHGLREVKVKQFYADVKLYFTAVTTYFVDKLPIKEPVLKHAEVLDVKLQQTAKLSDLTFFLDKFPVLIPKDCTADILKEQFAVYQYTDISSCISDRMDKTWAEIGRLKDEDGDATMNELSQVMRSILTIPHSNAHCERMFSTVRKNRTEQRASMGDDLLESLLLLKSQPGHPFDSNRQLSKGTLNKLKSAYYESNKGQSTK